MSRSTYEIFELWCGDLIKYIPSERPNYLEVIECLPVEGTDEEMWCVTTLDENGMYAMRYGKRDLRVSVKRRAHRKKKPSSSKVFRVESVRVNEEGDYDYALVRSGSFEVADDDSGAEAPDHETAKK